jgi:hypothetical protein
MTEELIMKLLNPYKVLAVIPETQTDVFIKDIFEPLLQSLKRHITHNQIKEMFVMYGIPCQKKLVECTSSEDGHKFMAPRDCYQRADIAKAAEKFEADQIVHRGPGRPSTHTTLLQFRIPEELYGKLILLARERGLSAKDYALQILLEKLGNV